MFSAFETCHAVILGLLEEEEVNNFAVSQMLRLKLFTNMAEAEQFSSKASETFIYEGVTHAIEEDAIEVDGEELAKAAVAAFNDDNNENKVKPKKNFIKRIVL